MWQNEELKEVPEGLWDKRTDIQVQEKTAKFKSKGDQEVVLFYREANPVDDPKSTAVLLLHGASFKSQTWLDLGTIQFIAAVGHRVVALDLPGYGESESAHVEPSQLMSNFCQCVGLDRPVIVSPSMSGTFSLPYIMSNPETARERARAFIPVAPSGTESFKLSQYEKCTVPTLALYGENDQRQGTASMASLKHMANSRTHKISKAGHACYMNQPEEWHKALYNFLTALEHMD